MQSVLHEHAATAHALIFFGSLSAVAAWESLAPLRRLETPTGRRWLGNFALMFINAVVLRLLLPVTGVALAVTAAQHGWGLLDVAQWPAWTGVLAAVVLLDFNRFAQHVLLHRAPLLWRIHRVHHTDRDLDCTTQLRFHPFEAVFSTGCYAAFIVALGLPAAGVVLHSLLVASIGFLQHGNVRCWRPLDSTLRWLIITPDMHRVHHSADADEANSNYGSLLPIWDRMFGTYVAEPARGHERMEIGLGEYRDGRSSTLRWLLLDPFTSGREPNARPAASAQQGRSADVSPIR